MTSLLGRLPPGGRDIFIKVAPLWVKRMACGGTQRHCALCETDLRELWPFGGSQRQNARCPACGSLERHRFIWRYLVGHTDLLSKTPKRMLHFAPEKCLERRFARQPGLDYVSADVRPGTAMLALDITKIDLPDASFDLVLCSHVLEHVEDDRRALSELRRIVKPGGMVIVLVPLRDGPTLEDPAATTPELRKKIYGQSDHVRHFGRDIAQRIEAAGFRVTALAPSDVMTSEQRLTEGMSEGDVIFRCEA